MIFCNICVKRTKDKFPMVEMEETDIYGKKTINIMVAVVGVVIVMVEKEGSAAVGTEVIMALVLQIRFPFQVEEVRHQAVVLVQREKVVA